VMFFVYVFLGYREDTDYEEPEPELCFNIGRLDKMDRVSDLFPKERDRYYTDPELEKISEWMSSAKTGDMLTTKAGHFICLGIDPDLNNLMTTERVVTEAMLEKLIVMEEKAKKKKKRRK